MGPVIMIVGVVLMIVIHEGGHFVAAKAFGMKATEAFFGFGPKIWSITRGETEYGIKAIPFGGYVRIIGMNPFEEVAPEEEGRTYRVAPFWKKTVVVLAGIFSHFVVAFLILWGLAMTLGTTVIGSDGLPARTTTVAAVSETLPDSDVPAPSSVAGTEAGDIIVGIDGLAVEEWDTFTDYVAAHGDETVVIAVERDGAIVELEATLATIERPVIDDDGEIVTDDDGEPVLEEAGFFGVLAEPQKDQHGILGAIPVAISQMGEAITQSIQGLWEMVIGFPKLIAALFGGDDSVYDTVRPISPIGLVQLAGPVESTLQLLALVNIFVGVLNFVPLYPLDGGHFAVALYEKVSGRTPNIERLLPVAAAVFLFLVSLGIMGIYLDIFRPIS